MALKSNPMVQRLVQSGEAQVTRLVQLVLSNEKFVSSVQSVVQTTLSAKGTFDKSVRAALGAMSLTTTADRDLLRERLGALEAVVSRLDQRVGQLDQAPAPKPRAKPRSKLTSA